MAACSFLSGTLRTSFHIVVFLVVMLVVEAPCGAAIVHWHASLEDQDIGTVDVVVDTTGRPTNWMGKQATVTIDFFDAGGARIGEEAFDLIDPHILPYLTANQVILRKFHHGYANARRAVGHELVLKHGAGGGKAEV
jgi:hypothetical protein